MVGEAGEGAEFGVGAAALCEGYAEDLGGFGGVVEISFVEVADPEEEHGVGMFGLDAHVLAHQGRIGEVLFGHRGAKLRFSLWNKAGVNYLW